MKKSSPFLSKMMTPQVTTRVSFAGSNLENMLKQTTFGGLLTPHVTPEMTPLVTFELSPDA